MSCWRLCPRQLPARFAAEYALANKVDLPKNVYLREADVIGRVDDWLTELFGPASLEATLSQLAEQGASSRTSQPSPGRTRPSRGSPV